MKLKFARRAAIAACAILMIAALPGPAAASGHRTDPVLVQDIVLDAVNPVAGAGYWRSSGCAGGLDTAPCIRLFSGAWVEYRITLHQAVDYLNRLERGNGNAWSSWEGCTWRLTGPGVDQERSSCPSDPNAYTESTSWWFRDSYGPGTYTLRISCGWNCNNIWLSQLGVRAYHFGLRGGIWEVDKDYFPEPGRLPGVPSLQFDRACVFISMEGSYSFPHVDYRVSWGDGTSSTGKLTMTRPWWGGEAYVGTSLCHNYAFPLSVYQVCLTATDGYPRTVNTCTTISGGIDPRDLVDDGVEYVVGTVT